MEKIVHRYSAHFPRWCQALGDHVPDPAAKLGRWSGWWALTASA